MPNKSNKSNKSNTSNSESSYTPSPSLLSVTTVSSSTPLIAPKQKDYSAAFGQLQSAYGSGGHAPVTPSHAKKTQQSPANPLPLRDQGSSAQSKGSGHANSSVSTTTSSKADSKQSTIKNTSSKAAK